MADSNDIAVDIQVKFAFYMVALVFTVLALAVETAEFGNSGIPDTFELISWLLLLISGLSALKRIEMMPRLHKIGSMMPNSDEAEKLQNEAIDTRQKVMLCCYRVHIWFFVFGLISLIFSRGYYGMINVLRYYNI